MNNLTAREGNQPNNNSLKTALAIMENSNAKIVGIPLIDRAINNAGRIIKSKMKNHFGFEFYLTNDNVGTDQLLNVNKWIAKYSRDAKMKISEDKKYPTRQASGLLSNSSFFIKIDKQTYATIKIGSEFRKLLTINEGLGGSFLTNTKIQDNDIYIYVFGKNSPRINKEIIETLDCRSESLRMYKVYGEQDSRNDVAFRSLYQDLENRDLDTIFLEGNVISDIEKHIDSFITNKELYTGRGIIYKTGILLYGEPGTGKTSLIKALANKYGYDLILMDMTSFEHIGLETLTHSLNIDDRKYIIALEDIDCVIADRDNKDIDKDEKKIVNKLLQFLDSNTSPNEVIFIATTNHIELLDEALLREGRFDLKREIGGVKEEQARRMCESFGLTDKQIDSIIYDIRNMGIDLKNDTIRQSKLQDMILKKTGMSIRSEVSEDNE